MCVLCKTHMNANSKTLNKHAGSVKHKANVKSQQGRNGNMVPHIEGRTTGNLHIRADVITCGYALCKWAKPFSDADKLKELLQSLNMVDKRMVNCKTFTMSDTYIKNVTVLKLIRPFLLSQLKSTLANCMSFSLMFDESICIAKDAKCIVFVNAAMPDGRRLVMMLSVDDIKGADALAVFTHVKAKLTGPDIEADMKKLASICTDGASVMRGHKAGAVKKLLDWAQSEHADGSYVPGLHCIIR